ncbi:uncharacterized protein LOC123396114 isoform X2 [Hordeum vulgare subsp. vulgare]|uniref:Uncharacterized protein n=1 Tax=Hordeum vulgare subsp. vulgare TaxID=112509 RepID=A0A8I6XHJ7_HORVV|nr:uncharacterized protein LOC123396114 isoform X1 [Hordeum vulgare subsp. vulgare]XP_044947093.1 uncharacterized protein LOC123396114 isoform X2 [Hordeum vulgare subsp. vulgare]
MAATVGELDRFEDLSVSSGTKKGSSFWEEEAAPKPTRRGGDKGSAKAEVPKPSRRGRRKAAGEQEKEAVVMPGRHGRQKACSQGEAGKGKGKKGPLPPAKNMMSEEDVMYILSWERREPYSRKNNKAAGFFNRLNNELFEYQQEIRDEFEEKGYVEIPDNFEEDNKRINLEAYRIAYLKVFGTEPPAKI